MEESIKYCTAILPKVSRTFAPTIRMLPQKLYLPVTVAYLLCRIADTIEDSDTLEVEQKKIMLSLYGRLFSDPESKDLMSVLMDEIRKFPAAGSDNELVHHLPIVWQVYQTFSERIQAGIATWVGEMIRGMQHYAQARNVTTVRFLHTMSELEEYTYYVAGTVGNLLTALFSLYSSRITPAIHEKLQAFSASFGRGLQMVNIIRDIPGDWRNGRSYIPEEILLKYRLTRQTLFDKENDHQAKLLIQELIQGAIIYLDAALSYFLLLPKKETRIRLFCLLPLFWALRTLQKVQVNILSLLEKKNIKISARTVKSEYYIALINVFSNRLTKYRYRKLRGQLTAALDTPV